MESDRLAGAPLEDLEALVRLAGEYVEPSADLRPSVLEAARAAAAEKQAQRRIAHLAAGFLLAITLTLYLSAERAHDTRAYVSPLGSAPLMPPSTQAGESNHSGWEMVESFTELRREQARRLRMAL